MNPLLKAREVEYHLRNSGARLVVSGEQSTEPVREAAGSVGIDVVAVGAALPDALLADETFVDHCGLLHDADGGCWSSVGRPARPPAAMTSDQFLPRRADQRRRRWSVSQVTLQ